MTVVGNQFLSYTTQNAWNTNIISSKEAKVLSHVDTNLQPVHYHPFVLSSTQSISQCPPHNSSLKQLLLSPKQPTKLLLLRASLQLQLWLPRNFPPAFWSFLSFPSQHSLMLIAILASTSRRLLLHQQLAPEIH